MRTGRWLSRATWARRRSNSGWFPTCRASCVCRSVVSACASPASAIATSRLESAASKYACVTSRASCARCDPSVTSATRRPASAIRFCAATDPPLKRFCDALKPYCQLLTLPKPTLLSPANGFPALAPAQRSACSSESTRCSIGSPGLGTKAPPPGVHPAGGPAVESAPAPPPNDENGEARVR
jgi:hypothetical protein